MIPADGQTLLWFRRWENISLHSSGDRGRYIRVARQSLPYVDHPNFTEIKTSRPPEA